MRHKYRIGFLVTCASILATAQVSAQVTADAEAPDQQVTLTTVLVTAQKREQSLQDVPIAVSAVSGTELRSSGVQTIEQMQSMVPNLNIGQNNGVARVTVRGVGLDNNSPSAEGSIAFHSDGVFIQRSQAALAGLYDLERVEVLRGPQGTLYGRNATGGSINVVTAKPTEDFSGYGLVSYGTDSALNLEGAVSGSLIEDLVLGRLSVKSSEHDGYGKNIITGTEIDDLQERSVRGQLQFLFGEDFDVLLIGDYTTGDDRSGMYHFGGFANPALPVPGLLAGGVVANDPRDVANRLDPNSEREFWGLSSTATWEISNNLTLKSITAYRHTEYFLHNTSLDATSLALFPILQDESANQFSQEVQLNGRFGDFEWITGLYYFREKNKAVAAGPLSLALLGGAPEDFLSGYYAGSWLKTDAVAAFGEASYQLTDRLGVTVGARFSREEKTVLDEQAFDFANVALSDRADSLDLLATPTFICGEALSTIPSCEPSHSWDSFTPKVAVEYDLDDLGLLYANFSRGFKSGTYNLGSVQGAPVDPEEVDAFEIGAKLSPLNGRLRANLAAFLYDYQDLQVSKVVTTQLRLENAATAKIQGLEAELSAQLSPSLRIDGAIGYLDAKFDSFISVDPTRPDGDGVTLDPATGQPAFNLEGNRLPQAPEFSGRLSFEYQTDIRDFELTLRGNVSHSTQAYFTAFNQENISRPDLTTLGASASLLLPDGRTRLSITGRNLTDETEMTNAFVATVFTGAPILGFLNEPRSVAVSLEHSF